MCSGIKKNFAENASIQLACKSSLCAANASISLLFLLLLACANPPQRDQGLSSLVLDDAEQGETSISYSCTGSQCKIATCEGEGRKQTTSRCLTMGDRTWGARTSSELTTDIDLANFDELELWFRMPTAEALSQTIELTVSVSGTNEFHQQRKWNLSRLSSPPESWTKIAVPLAAEQATFLLSFELQLLTGGTGLAFHFDDIRLISKDTTNSGFVVEPVYPTNGEWNQYVQNGNPGKDAFHQQDTACTSSNGPGYGACIHGGEKRTAILSSETNCNGLIARDRLGAFDWQCVDRSGVVEWFSMGLKPNKRLSHLLDGNAGTWRPNQLIIERSGKTIVTSEPAQWWTNPVIDLITVEDPHPATPAIDLTVPGGIYYVAANFASPTGYNIGAKEIAITVFEGSTLSYSDSANGEKNCGAFVCLVDATTTPKLSQLWIEGQFAGDRSGRVERLVTGDSLSFSVFRHLEASRAGGRALNLRNTRHSLVTDIFVHNSGRGLQLHAGSHHIEINRVLAQANSDDGIHLNNVQDSRLVDITSVDNGRHGIQIGSSSTNFVHKVRTAHNQGTGLKLEAGRDHVQQVYSANNGGPGISIRFFHGSVVQAVAVHNELHGITVSPSNYGSFVAAVTAVNNLATGVHIYNSTQSVFSNLAAINNGGSGLRFMSNSHHHQVFGSTLAFNIKDQLRTDSDYATFHDLRISDAGGCMISGTGNNVEQTNVCSYTSTEKVPVVDPSASFVRRILADNSNTTPLTNGNLAVSSDEIDWIHFDHPFRGWGPYNGGFPSDTNQGPCTPDTSCSLWDWSVRTDDTTLLGQSDLPDGNTIGTFFWNAANSGECTQRGGEWNRPAEGDCTSPFLLHAYEVMNDHIGNDNNLCENGETCIYTPNHGAYQGHGTLTPVNFVDGTITGVTLLRWSKNGR